MGERAAHLHTYSPIHSLDLVYSLCYCTYRPPSCTLGGLAKIRPNHRFSACTYQLYRHYFYVAYPNFIVIVSCSIQGSLQN